ncbi:MAG: hypothetical protein ACRD20_18655 [Terriglobales bacterium]
MQQPIKVRGRFATVHDTAETLGVSQSRTRALIRTVKEFTEGIAYRDYTNGSFAARKKTKSGSPATAVRMKKNSGRHAEAAKKKSHARASKAHR